MKRHGNIYEKVCTTYNISLAHRCAKKDKSFYKEVIMVDGDKDYYLGQIQDVLKNKTYKVSPYIIKTINDKGKERQLAKLPYFPDRIIQWAIMLQIEKVFMETFTSFTCASINNRGIHKASSTFYCMVNSYKGWLGYCDGTRLSQKYISPVQESIDEFYQKEIKGVEK